MSRAALVVLLVVPLLAVSACGEDSGGENCTGSFCVGSAPRLDVAPQRVTFAAVGVGDTADQLLTIRNTGDATLEITEARLRGADADVFGFELEPGRSRDGVVLVIAPDDEAEVLVTYAPRKVGGAEAELCFESNDPNDPTLCVALTALESGPLLQVSPDPILFGVVAANTRATLDVTLTNVGTAPLEPIVVDADDDGVLESTGISLTGSTDFVPERGTRDAILHAALTEPLAPGASLTLTLAYEPQSDAPDEGELQVRYRFDDEERLHRTPVSGNAAAACLRVTPQSIGFGPVAVGSTARRILSVENCGTDTLEISAIALSEDSSAAFGLDMLPLALDNGGILELSPGALRQFYVTYTPTTEDAANGALEIASNDAARPVVSVPLAGIGSDNGCPVARAEGQLVRDARGQPIGAPAPPATTLSAEVLSTVRLRPTGSLDPDGDAITGYQWSIVAAPPGFSLGLQPSATAEEVDVQLALIGDYVFELTVVDARGTTSCEPARVHVSAISDKRLVVELVWRTPSDLDETDIGTGAGTDLDLHLLNGATTARWDDTLSGAVRGQTDCYFANPRPEWGDTSAIDDNPSLDRDDIDGGGPEQINIREPARSDGSSGSGYTRPYQVGVYFYDAHGFAPPVYATVRVYLDGDPVPAAVWPTNVQGKALTQPDPSSAGQGDFWLAGEIAWTATGGQLTERDVLHRGFPD